MPDDAPVVVKDPPDDDLPKDPQHDEPQISLTAAELQDAVKRYRTENASWRTKHRNLQGEVESLKSKIKDFEDRDLAAETDLKKRLDAYEKRDREREKETAERLSAANRRFVLSEAKRLAKEAGIIDVDDVTVLDLSELRVDEDDNVNGLSDMIDQLKEAKPHWFKSAKDAVVDQRDKTKTVVTPDRKDGADTGKDWKTASKDEVSKTLRAYGVMA